MPPPFKARRQHFANLSRQHRHHGRTRGLGWPRIVPLISSFDATMLTEAGVEWIIATWVHLFWEFG